MQHNLVLSNGVHLRTDPEGLEEMYEFAVPDCLHRLRWGRMLAMTQERLGGVAMEVVRMVMVYGKLTPGDVMRVMSAEGDGQSESSQVTSSQVESADCRGLDVL